MSPKPFPPRSPRPALAAVAAAVLLAACGGGSESGAGASGSKQAAAAAAVPAPLASIALPAGSTAAAAPRRDMSRNGVGQVDLWVQLEDAPLSVKKRELRPEAPGQNWRASDATLRSELRAYRQSLGGRQNSAAATLAALGARELARVQVAHNALAIRVDARRIAEIEAMPGVVAVRPVRHYELMLGETVPYVGGAAAQAGGADGSGVRVAVLDSGIDYTHRNLGGPGTPEAYVAAWGSALGDPAQTTRDGLFPTAKVVDGFDFVGEAWPNCAPDTDCRTEDPDPIDLEGHGTHVADIIAGVGPNKGMAPGAKLVAVKVCSAVSSACNGIALIKGMDFALDPDGDGDPADAVDVINMSLGAAYGQQEDDLYVAAANAVKLGVSVVASAGNNANRPYITGSPAAAPGVLSVAQTQVPSAVANPLVVTGITPSVIANTNTVDWAPLGSGFSGPVVRAGTACPGEAIFNGNSLSGRVALIDRGACNISLKVDVATKAGAVAVILANNAGGDPPTFSFGGGDLPLVPTIVVTQADGNRIKTALGATGLNPAVVASVSTASSIPLVGGMVSTSSRGPGFSDSALKPEIGAPGASVSAIAGSGAGEEAFGGTSGASPMVAGAAAILRGAFPDRTPLQIKAMLMNSADAQVYTNPATQPGVLAPVSRIGAGELRVARALALQSIVHNPKARTAALPFGFAEVGASAMLRSELVIENLGTTWRRYTLSHAYRYADDAASGATRLEMPGQVWVAPGRRERVEVRMRVDGRKLPAWGLDGGPNGGNGALLEANEVDGYVTVSDGSQAMQVPFHALLRKSAGLDVAEQTVRAGKDIRVRNRGVNEGYFDVFALTGTSPKFRRSEQPGPGDNFALVDLRAAGVRTVADSFLQFAVSRWDRRAHPAYPAEIDVYVDSNNDGVDDYVLFTAEAVGFGASGQVLVNVFDLNTGAVAAYFYLDADLQSGNGILTVPMAAIGVTPASTIRFSVYAFDNYFTGLNTDAIEGMQYSLSTPKYAIEGGVIDGLLGAGESLRLGTQAVAGGAAASPSQTGFMLMYRQNDGVETEIVRIQR